MLLIPRLPGLFAAASALAAADGLSRSGRTDGWYALQSGTVADLISVSVVVSLTARTAGSEGYSQGNGGAMLKTELPSHN